jgi:rhodanese-related sulfurtransferase
MNCPHWWARAGLSGLLLGAFVCGALLPIAAQNATAARFADQADVGEEDHPSMDYAREMMKDRIMVQADLANALDPFDFFLELSLFAGQAARMVPTSRVGKIMTFYSFGPGFAADSCWGPCKAALFEQTRQEPASEPVSLNEPPQITVPTLAALLKAAVPVTLCDARPDTAGGAIPGSVRYPFASSSLEMQHMTVVYGAGENGTDSRDVVEALRQAGFGNVVELKEGLAGWASAGMPLQ